MVSLICTDRLVSSPLARKKALLLENVKGLLGSCPAVRELLHYVLQDWCFNQRVLDEVNE